MKLNLEKIPVLGSKFWGDLGVNIKYWILDDCLVGLFQNGKQKLWYKSEQYKKYKANDYKKFGRGEKKIGKGEKLEGYKTRNTNTNTQFVNMILTQDMLNSLRPVDYGETYVDMEYGQEHIGKILGGRALGREIVGLNNKNRRFIKAKMIKEYKKLIGDNLPKKIVIDVGSGHS